MLTSPLVSPLLGASRPRVELRPPAAYSLGAEAVELARRAGLPLEQWQADGLDLMLSVRDDGRWACFEYGELCSRQNGKTIGLFAPRALAGLFLFGERLIMWSAHEYKTAMESFLQVRDMILALGTEVKPNLIEIPGDDDPILVKVNNTNGEEAFERLDTHQRIKFLARSKGSGRGFSGDVNLIDEAFAYTRSQQSALMPTMTARPNPQICYASSPPLDSETGEPLFALRARAEAGDVGLGWRDWGLEKDLQALEQMTTEERRAFLDDRANWAATNPAVGRGRVTDESIERNRRSMAEVDFGREVLGMWPLPPSEGGRVIRRATWNALADVDSHITGQPVFAIDATPERSFAAIGSAGWSPSDRTHVEVADHRRGLDWVVARCVELNKKHEPAAFVIDPRGPAGSLVPDLEAAGLPVEAVTTSELVQACGGFYDAVHADEPQLTHLGDPLLNDAVDAGRKRDVGDGGWAWGRKNSETNIAPLVAVTLAYYGLATHGGDPLDDIR